MPREGFCDAAITTNTLPGDEMSAQGFVRYLRAYQRRFDLDVFTDTEVVGAEREAPSSDHRRWGAGGGGDDEDSAGAIRVRFRR